MIYKNTEELIGATPLLELCRTEQALGLQARLLVKAERFNPGGSAKDRPAKWMLDDAERQGILKPGGTVIEATSGNTGVGLAMVGVPRGYRVIIIMPETMSVERQMLMKAYGAELILTPGNEGMTGAVQKAQQLHKEIPGSIIAGQFDNPANARAHYETTGPEIWKDTDGRVDCFVAGVGTGGTITGVGRYLKEKNKNTEIIAVEPAGSPVLSGGQAGPHKIQGIGGGFVPGVLDREIYDRVITVQDGDALAAGAAVAVREGLLVGISSGAALWAAIELAKKPEYAGKTVVALLTDTGERYLSTEMFR